MSKITHNETPILSKIKNMTVINIRYNNIIIWERERNESNQE